MSRTAFLSPASIRTSLPGASQAVNLKVLPWPGVLPTSVMPPISRQLVELMGGEIGVGSRPGAGSTFHFVVRLGRASAAAAGGVDEAALPGDQRVLVIDDNLPTRKLLTRKLTDWGVPVDAAATPEKALRLLELAAAQGRPYTVAFVDRTLPGMDGFTLARAIRADTRLAGIRLLMFSAHQDDMDAATLHAAGIDDYLCKPASFAQIRDRLQKLVSPGAPPASAETLRQPAGIGRGRRILLAEDNVVNQEVALSMLEVLGFRVDLARDGQEAIALDRDTDPDLILMDCHMPALDGFDAAASIRRREAETGRARRPIIALTADVQKGIQEQCREAGMDDYLSKPFSQDELTAALEPWLPAAADHDGTDG